MMNKIKKLFDKGGELLSRRQSGILSGALVIALTYGVSMVLGIFRQRLLVSRFFPCCKEQLDVYLAASRLPDMIFQMVVVGALSAAFIPVFSEVLLKDEARASRFASSLINLMIFFFVGLSAVVFVFAEPFSKMITGSFTPSQIQLMAQMTRVMLLAQMFFLVSNFIAAMIQSHQRFLLPSLSPVVYNLGIVICVGFLSPIFGIWSATIGVLVGSFLHLLIQLPLLSKLKFRYFFIFDIKGAEIKKVLRLMLPRTLALAASQVELTVAMFLATSLSAGSLTLYDSAQKLADLPVRFLGTSVGQAALPSLSLHTAQNMMDNFKDTLRKSLDTVFFLALPATVIFLVMRVQFVRFAYGAKDFPWSATITTGQTLAAVTLSIFPQCAIQLLVRGFYALHDTYTPFVISVVSVLLSVVLSLFFVFRLGLGIFGLALAFSISNFLNMFLLLVAFNRSKERFLSKEEVISWLKMFFSALLCGLSLWGTMRLLDLFVFETSKTFYLLLLTMLSILVGLLVYIASSICLKIKEFYVILGLFGRFEGWRKTLFSVKETVIET